MDVNVPLLRKTLEHITAHPDEWDQQYWAERTICGTTYCLAGWAVALNGAEIKWADSIGVGAYEVIRSANLTDGREIEQAALEALGIEPVQVAYLDDRGVDLFSTKNTLRDLYTIANEYTDGEIEIPTTLPDGS